MSIADPVQARSGAEPARPTLASLAALHRLFCVPSAAVNLAVLRIAVFTALAVTTLQAHVVDFSRLPDALLVARPQLGGILTALPRDPTLVQCATWALVGACVAAAAGWRFRPSSIVVALLSLYVLGIPQLYGKVDHYHHLVWLAWLLACSPCADQLVLGRSRRAPAASVRYGFPLRIAWVLIGCCYLFPGLAKLGESRIWLSSGNLRGLLEVQQWAAHGGVSIPSWALLPMAAATLVFEIGFLFAMFNRRLRPWFLVAGIAFHVGTFVTMRILFWDLWILYVAFIDWSRWFGGTERTDPRDPARPTLAMSALLLIGVGFTGFTGLVAAWPFASYPTFVGSYSGVDRAATVQVVAVTDGQERTLPLLDWLPASRRSAVLRDALHHPRVLAAMARDVAPDAQNVQVWQIDESTRPRDRGHTLDRTLLLRVDAR